MALQRDTRYPGRWTTGNAAHPQGAFKNRTAPGSLDGSYIEQDWANDWDGFFARLMTVAGMTANGTIDTATASQYYDALLAAMPGRLIGTQKITASGTYTPTPGMKTCRVRGVGGGGGSGGSAATAAGTYTVTGGGSSGGYSEGWFTAAQIGASISVTIGVAGAAGASGPNNGGNGGTTSLGALMVIPGGGGAVAVASTPNSSPALSVGGTPGAAPTGGSLVNMTGISGTFGVGTTTSGLTTSGVGGSTPLGAGGFSTTLSTPVSGTGYGAGGSGAVTPSSFAARAGAPGTAGVLIIEEFA